uniref:Uncharacterized protein n=1 Tax=Siphoviridae sp. ctqPo10 TaxID=2827948 RepID=A0A8S5SVC1_9CAUD|nr:MAG TPA: hypothetical protein [Siphoviridae sp. ctqPo10]
MRKNTSIKLYKYTIFLHKTAYILTQNVLK